MPMSTIMPSTQLAVSGRVTAGLSVSVHAASCILRGYCQRQFEGPTEARQELLHLGENSYHHGCRDRINKLSFEVTCCSLTI